MVNQLGEQNDEHLQRQVCLPSIILFFWHQHPGEAKAGWSPSLLRHGGSGKRAAGWLAAWLASAAAAPVAAASSSPLGRSPGKVAPHAKRRARAGGGRRGASGRGEEPAGQPTDRAAAQRSLGAPAGVSHSSGAAPLEWSPRRRRPLTGRGGTPAEEGKR